MWRHIDGRLVIRFNGEIDCGDVDNMNAAPNLFFVSDDDGESWSFAEKGEEEFDISVLNGIDGPYVDFENAKLAFREKPCRKPLKNVNFQKEFMMPNKEAIVRSYRYGDIPDECKGVEMLRYDASEGTVSVLPVIFDFPEREILIYDEGDGVFHKAAFVRKITLTP